MMIEMKVFGLAVDENSQVPVLVLKDLEEKAILPIWIGAMEAMAISLALNEVKLPRPMTHDLMLSCIDTAGAKVTAVEVVKLEEGTYYAEVEMRIGEVQRRVDARPSDAIALALRAEAPIRVAQAVLDEASVDDTALGKPVLKDEESDKWTEMLEGFSPGDKYKM
ncbi:hypothetical protein PCS_01374 [Desulfocurvibacter africanus PCS]|uniref:BFN domain-containing protein n=3 Tax=Desulfocurvibacter africanus TaxID=873 RepID=F3Z038_DESAF|nr:protein of unknown function DUF151 [Desulfocurvibacter africanus subsp. africanus str. Walvis Bay]EMG37975.1 hypothetical protein PCS_01374 [Desulfocurvibacter africanus PCS]